MPSTITQTSLGTSRAAMPAATRATASPARPPALNSLPSATQNITPAK